MWYESPSLGGSTGQNFLRPIMYNAIECQEKLHRKLKLLLKYQTNSVLKVEKKGRKLR